jgi:hypothetical protein
MAELGNTLRGEMAELGNTLRAEMRQQGDELRAEMRAGDNRLAGLIEELGVHMRVLHEDVIGRIAVLGEALNGRKGGKRRR